MQVRGICALNKAIVLIDKKYIRANKQQKYKKNINEGCIQNKACENIEQLTFLLLISIRNCFSF